MKLKQNVGTIDRSIRLILAVVLAVFLLGGGIKGLAAIILWVVALIALITGTIGFCGLYAVLGITTNKK
jgi:hypothetical protein